MSSPPSSLASFAQPINVLVTGASRGIGLAIVKRLLADQAVAQLFAAAREGAREEKLAALAADGRNQLLPLDMNVSIEGSVAAAAARVAVEVSRIDLIINWAGVLHDGARVQPEKRLDDVVPESLERSFAVNAIGPLLVAKHFQAMLPRQDRAVFASLSARVGSIGDNRLGGWYGYRASKAAQNMITRNLAIELRRRVRGIICVALHPGTVDTELSGPFQVNVPAERLFSPDRAACHLLSVIDALRVEDNGEFFAWDGQPIPW